MWESRVDGQGPGRWNLAAAGPWRGRGGCKEKGWHRPEDRKLANKSSGMRSAQYRYQGPGTRDEGRGTQGPGERGRERERE